MSTDPKTTMEMLEKFLNTPFKSPCPASDSEAWPENVQSSCAICELAKGREFSPVGIMSGGVILLGKTILLR
ncbi:hypothetical protein Tco_1288487 [Tanacetum coccineum]